VNVPLEGRSSKERSKRNSQSQKLLKIFQTITKNQCIKRRKNKEIKSLKSKRNLEKKVENKRK